MKAREGKRRPSSCLPSSHTSDHEWNVAGRWVVEDAVRVSGRGRSHRWRPEGRGQQRPCLRRVCAPALAGGGAGHSARSSCSDVLKEWLVSSDCSE